MQTQKLFTFGLVVLLFFVSVTPCQAIFPETRPSKRLKLDPSWWNFRTPAQLDVLVIRWKANPRALYYITTNAINRGFASEMAASLEKLLKKAPLSSDNFLRAFVAYSYWGAFNSSGLGGGNWADLFAKKQGAFTWLLIVLENKASALPETLAIAGAGMSMELFSDQNSFQKKEIPEKFLPVLQALERAIRLDPQWADARYWYGFALTQYFDSLPHLPMSSKKHLLAKSEASLLAAQRIDPNLQGSCARILSTVKEEQGQMRESLFYQQRWLKAQPRYANNPWQKKRQARLQALVK